MTTEKTSVDQATEATEIRESATADGTELAEHDQEKALEAEFVTLRGELEAARQEILYAQADTQNVRRRMEKEASDARAYAASAFARDVLSVADNLTRALEAIPADLRGDDKFKGLVTGLEATGRELESVFGRNGIEKIVSIGQVLDPNRHQAMVEVPNADVEPGTIIHEMQTGYMIKDRLLRPALVGVAKKPD